MVSPSDPAGRHDDPQDEPHDDPRDDVPAEVHPWPPPPLPVSTRLIAWQRASILGAVCTGFALGLKEFFDSARDEQIVIEVDADGEPHDLPIRLVLDPDDPRGSLCIVRRDPPPPVV